MQVDALNQRRKLPPKKPFSNNPPTKKQQRLPPHPTAASSSSQKKSFAPAVKKGFKCFLCDKPGHFARDCQGINNLSVQRLRQIGTAMEAMEQSGEVRYEDLDEEEEAEEDLQNYDEESEVDQDVNLISFEEQPAPSEEHYYQPDGQGF
jgi:hypothetical protein